MSKYKSWMSAYGPACIPAVALASILIGIAAGLCDAVMGGLILAGLASIGESIAYTLLAAWSTTPEHARSYSFVAGVNWTTSLLLVLILLAGFGVRLPTPLTTPIVESSHGLQPRNFERIKTLPDLQAAHPHQTKERAEFDGFSPVSPVPYLTDVDRPLP